MLIDKHTLDFIPVHRAVGWPVHRVFGWSIDDESKPQLWWRARLSKSGRLVMSDGSDAYLREAHVQLTIGESRGDALRKRGVLIAPGHVEEVFNLGLTVSRETFDRVLQAVLRREPPTVTVAFGAVGRYKQLTTGPVTTPDKDEPFRHYRWDDAKEKLVVIEACEFSFSHELEETENPGIPAKSSAVLRALGIGWGIVVNLLAVLIAIAVLNAANTRFESAVVSVLLLIYIYLWSSHHVRVDQGFRAEFRAVARFYQLRALMGMPASGAENKYLRWARERTEKPGYRFWMDTASNAIIGLLALYRLATLVL